ncbi:MAG: 50S ribosomal protein L15 [Candidatus Omnitrophica bacterium]|nr:50S ribosomal protein L15 [Candidatus Omnitrophota bacterium]
MNLSNIIKIGKKTKKPKRLGRGPGSGTGKTAGRGHKGAGQRSGKKLPYIGFRGGNLPLARTLPKRGFTPPRKVEYQIVNLGEIQKRAKGTEEINPTVLKKLGLIQDEKKPVKVLAKIEGKLSKKLIIKVDKFSAKAKEFVEAAGGSIECLTR